MALIGDLLKRTVHTLPQAATLLCAPYPKVGIEIECENFTTRAKIPSKWESKEDGSLRNRGQEFITVGGLVGRDIEVAVVEFCDWAQKVKLDVGYPRAGIHIHLDCTDLDWNSGELARMISLYMIVEDAMFSLAGEWRRTCGFCDALADAQADFVGLGRCLYDQKLSATNLNMQLQNLNKYTALNLLPLTRFGTVEFRQLETTFDAERILNWINIIVAIKEGARNMPAGLDWMREFSRLGPTEFVKIWLAPVWSVLESHFHPGRAWNAIDNAIALMVEGHALPVPGISWEGAGILNPVITAKLALPEDKQAKKDEPVPELNEPLPGPEAFRRQPGEGMAGLMERVHAQMAGAQERARVFNPPVVPPRGRLIPQDRNHIAEFEINRRAIDIAAPRRNGESIANYANRVRELEDVLRANMERELAMVPDQAWNPPLRDQWIRLNDQVIEDFHPEPDDFDGP